MAIDIFQRIEHEILFTLGGNGYSISIKEVGSAVRVPHKLQAILHHSNMEDKDSNGDIPGFKDVEDDVSNKQDEEVKDTPTNSNSRGFKKPMNNIGSNIHSMPRTNTVVFSQNGYSQEVFKLSQHLNRLGNDEVNKQSTSNEKHRLGFGNSVNIQSNDWEQRDPPKCLETKGIQMEEGEFRIPRNEKDVPPGFEPRPTTHICSQLQLRTKKATKPKSQKDPLERRGATTLTTGMRELPDLLLDLQLVDIDIDYKFTWIRKNAASRIDRIVFCFC
ncbi:hypothetical protein Cgig2_005790 [Carnegiea gigantea]|uniref:Uncharacterized protein n=1 Tax=Carnegiea gigantea TaxID=171969 RepID=A0A9Q1KIF6_9CARY|nr:hypothetical protein Cgig2_005790 [Carnegiea gigantea]